jgi:hypothetical protein
MTYLYLSIYRLELRNNKNTNFTKMSSIVYQAVIEHFDHNHRQWKAQFFAAYKNGEMHMYESAEHTQKAQLTFKLHEVHNLIRMGRNTINQPRICNREIFVNKHSLYIDHISCLFRTA